MSIQEPTIPSANILAQGSIRSYSSGIPVVLAFRSFQLSGRSRCPVVPAVRSFWLFFGHSKQQVQNENNPGFPTVADLLFKPDPAGCVSWRWCSTRAAWRSSPPGSTSWTASRSPSAPSHTASSPASSRWKLSSSHFPPSIRVLSSFLPFLLRLFIPYFTTVFFFFLSLSPT